MYFTYYLPPSFPHDWEKGVKKKEMLGYGSTSQLIQLLLDSLYPLAETS